MNWQKKKREKQTIKTTPVGPESHVNQFVLPNAEIALHVLGCLFPVNSGESGDEPFNNCHTTVADGVQSFCRKRVKTTVPRRCLSRSMASWNDPKCAPSSCSRMSPRRTPASCGASSEGTRERPRSFVCGMHKKAREARRVDPSTQNEQKKSKPSDFPFCPDRKRKQHLYRETGLEHTPFTGKYLDKRGWHPLRAKQNTTRGDTTTASYQVKPHKGERLHHHVPPHFTGAPTTRTPSLLVSERSGRGSVVGGGGGVHSSCDDFTHLPRVRLPVRHGPEPLHHATAALLRQTQPESQWPRGHRHPDLLSVGLADLQRPQKQRAS